jgi:hypothetical protein
MKVLVDIKVHSEYVQGIKFDFTPRSVERSIDLCQRGYTSAAGRRYFQFPPPINIERFSSGYKNLQAIFQI